MPLTKVTSDVISTNTISGLISAGFTSMNVATMGTQTIEFGSSNTLVFQANTSAERMRISANGDIGIGTSNPLFSTGYRCITLNANTGGVYEIRANNIQAGALFNDSNGLRVRALANVIFDSVNTERMRITTTGQVAVSANGSANAPIISKSDDLNTGIFFPAADTIAFTEGGTESMRIDNSGNVGIGTSSPSVKLDIRGTTGASSTLRIGSDSNDSGTIQFFNTTGSTVNSTIAGNLENGNDGGNIAFSTKPVAGSLTERMRITSGGNVGIGTSSPGYKLVVDGSSSDERVYFQNTNASGSQYFIVSAATGRSITTFVPGTSTAFSNQYANPLLESATVLNLSGVTDMRMFTQNAERMRITSGGDVGIGTASPTALLHVNGTAKATSMSLNGVAIGDYNLYSGMVTRVSNGGGIGINSANSSDNAYIYFGSGTTSAAQQSAAIGRIGGDVLVMFTASTERMRIDSSGRVTMPYQPYFAAHATGTAAYLTVAEGVAFPANSTVFNIGSHYNTSTYRFTAPVTGNYLFTYSTISSTADAMSRPTFYVNGSSAFNGLQFGISGGDRGSESQATSAIIRLNANDYVDVRSQGGSLYYYGSAHSSFTGILLS